MTKTRLLTFFAIAILAALSVGLSWAQSPAAAPAADTLEVNYFVNANTGGAPDGTVQIDNPGTSGPGNICAEIYVFYPDEEMTECCGCTLTPDDLRTLSINVNLTSNPLVGRSGNSRRDQDRIQHNCQRMRPSEVVAHAIDA